VRPRTDPTSEPPRNVCARDDRVCGAGHYDLDRPPARSTVRHGLHARRLDDRAVTRRARLDRARRAVDGADRLARARCRGKNRAQAKYFFRRVARVMRSARHCAVRAHRVTARGGRAEKTEKNPGENRGEAQPPTIELGLLYHLYPYNNELGYNDPGYAKSSETAGKRQKACANEDLRLPRRAIFRYEETGVAGDAEAGPSHHPFHRTRETQLWR
jgi:hypothetical protein